ncbi:MAG TPA: hypothetical protein VFH47_08340 [Candidatus Thermoplasmatota archaeon]|nr:hypothetical protein [Candidatus Thermoplasmatota archaeon]
MARKPSASLPFVDEHQCTAGASLAQAWAGLVEELRSTFSGAHATAFARAVGCQHLLLDLLFPGKDATIVGFRAADVRPPHALVLEGHHRFARYRLSFRLAPDCEGTRLSATTHAAFPGAAGAAYRALVIGTRLHVLVTRGILRRAAARAQRAAHRERLVDLGLSGQGK